MGNPLWETLQTCARAEMQQFVQRLLEEEVDEMLGCAKGSSTPQRPPRAIAMSRGSRGNSR